MKQLANILDGLTFTAEIGSRKLPINKLCFDSRQVGKDDVFVAIRGTQADGHQFIPMAISRGAVAIICEQLPEDTPDNVSFFVADDSAYALGIMANLFYDQPSKKLKLVGITGTNGKTTCATLLYELFMRAGYSTGLLSTIENKINQHILPTSMTTPDVLTINRVLAEMVMQGCTHAFMEVSSHALDQKRVAGIQFTGAIFTNISHDHLDYHLTFQAYISAKKKLFDMLPKSAFALYNADDKRGTVMVQNCKANIQSFALKSIADFKANIIDMTFDGQCLSINGQEAWYLLTGDFNAYNLLTVYSAASLLGESPDAISTILSGIRPAKGRFEQIPLPKGNRAIVDYAHTPDALEQTLKTIRAIGDERFGKILTVVGCGGNRDKAKRPLMAQVATKYSDKVIFTSDNPRDEDPIKIIQEMLKGLDAEEKVKTNIIENREEAIRTALQTASQDMIILIAGKGHESYQEIAGVKNYFSDQEEVIKFITREKVK